MNVDTATASANSLLERLGGEQALEGLVGALYFNILNDKRVARFFASSDVDTIREHQRRFLVFALGGENAYRGRNMTEAHRQLVEEKGLNATHFDAIVEILGTTLADFGYAAELVREVVTLVASLRDDVLGTN